MGKTLNRNEALEILKTYTKTDSLIKHALAVEATMSYFAELENEDKEKWGIIGLLHDLDYEKYPDEHCKKTAEILKELDIDDSYIHAICSHGYGSCTDIEPALKMEKILYTIDELTGLINATCLMRPSKSILDVELKSIKKKFKDQSFAAGVNRKVILNGCEMLGCTLDDIISKTILGMRTNAEGIGLKGNL